MSDFSDDAIISLKTIRIHQRDSEEAARVYFESDEEVDLRKAYLMVARTASLVLDLLDKSLLEIRRLNLGQEKAAAKKLNDES